MSLKVLVAEDSPDFRELLQYYLELNGFRVRTADNGKDAVSLSAKTKPNIILMDLNLPVLDGWTATRLIRERPSTSQIPIVVVSSYCRDYALRQAAIKAGAVECLYKPISMEKLPRLIADYAIH